MSMSAEIPLIGNIVQRASGAVQTGLEFAALAKAIQSGEHDPSKLTNLLFFARHPGRQGRKLTKGEPNFDRLANEWKTIRDGIVIPTLHSRATSAASSPIPAKEPASMSPGQPGQVRIAAPNLPYAGPAIGPIHSGVAPPAPDLRKGVPGDAVLSPLSITLRGLRKAPHKMARVAQIVVHTTSRGPANRSKENRYRRPAIDYALNYYLGGKGGFPHYVIDFSGTIYATCDERYQAHHAGWVHPGGRKLFENQRWQAPAWWLAVWGKYGFRSPLDLLPKGARSPNSQSIGIELLISLELSYTEMQYRSLARLILDISRRHGFSVHTAPSLELLGHEDFAPLLGDGGRATREGGWDPGAHRTRPYFSWSKLLSIMRSI